MSALAAGRPAAAARRSLLSIVALALLSACGDGAPAGGAPSAAPPPPVPPPPDLALECVVPAPDVAWEKARAQIGGPASFLPRSAGGLAALTLHFPIAVSEAIDGRVPAVCAGTLSSDGATARAVLGVHLRWPDRLLDGLTKGEQARFTARVDPATQITLLEARDAKDAVMPAAVLDNYLLIAARAEDLTSLGPYVARTMPGRAKALPTSGVRVAGAPEPPPMDLLVRVPPPALGGPVGAAGARAWATVRERAAGVLGAPFPILGVANEALALLPDLDGAELRVAFVETGLRVEVTAPVRPGSGAEARLRALPAGDAAPLLAMPKDTLAGVLVRRPPTAASATEPLPGGGDAGAAPSAANTSSADAGGGDAGAADAGSGDAGAPALDLAGVLGVTEPGDAAAMEAAGRALERSAGDWLAAGFAFDGTGPSGFVRAAVRDADGLDSALKDLVRLSERAAPADPVKGHELRIKTGKTVLENIPGDVHRLRIARRSGAAPKSAEPPASPSDTPGAVDVLVRRRGDVLVAAAGYASRDALRALLEAPSGESLAQVPEVAGPLGRLGPGGWLALFVDPGRVAASRAGKPGSVPPAVVVVGLGRTGAEALTIQLSVEAARPAVAELARWLSP